jgi:hypothetical protein
VFGRTASVPTQRATVRGALDTSHFDGPLAQCRRVLLSVVVIPAWHSAALHASAAYLSVRRPRQSGCSVKYGCNDIPFEVSAVCLWDSNPPNSLSEGSHVPLRVAA